jgi:hypothetical protein
VFGVVCENCTPGESGFAGGGGGGESLSSGSSGASMAAAAESLGFESIESMAAWFAEASPAEGQLYGQLLLLLLGE